MEKTSDLPTYRAILNYNQAGHLKTKKEGARRGERPLRLEVRLEREQD